MKEKLWLKCDELMELIGISRTTVSRRRIPWQEESAPFRIRYKWLRLEPGRTPKPRYYRPDAEALLQDPPALAPQEPMCARPLKRSVPTPGEIDALEATPIHHWEGSV